MVVLTREIASSNSSVGHSSSSASRGIAKKKPSGSTCVACARSAASRAGKYAAHGTRDYRIGVQSFGEKTAAVDQALEYDARAVAALLDHRLEVSGLDCGPIRLQVGGAIVRDPDTSGVVGVTSALIFTTTKETS